MDTIDCLKSMLSFPSVSNVSNADVSDFVEDKLRALNFETERVEFIDPLGVRKVNVMGRRAGTSDKPSTQSGSQEANGLAWFGHTDVVPADDWSRDHSAFEGTVEDGRLYARGSCDMKGPIACMLSAAEQFANEPLKHPLYITCTADEEVGYRGALEVVKQSEYYRSMVRENTRAVIGEPTMLNVVYAHKGSYGFQVRSAGRAAHSSTTLGINANLAMIPFLMDMKDIHDETTADARYHNDEFDPPTVSWNIGINDHTHAVNITPPQSVCTVYFRPMPGVDGQALLKRVEESARKHGVEFSIGFVGEPMYTPPDSDFIRETLAIANQETPHTVCYGTDGAAFTELQHRVVLGPGDIAQAHTNNEWITLDQLEKGTELYARLIRNWCCES